MPDSGYALILDETYHAVLLRDLFDREAQKHHDRWANATQKAAMVENKDRFQMYSKYAERCERIRLEVVRRTQNTLGVST